MEPSESLHFYFMLVLFHNFHPLLFLLFPSKLQVTCNSWRMVEDGDQILLMKVNVWVSLIILGQAQNQILLASFN